MSGIIFFKTGMLDNIKRFYIEEVGCEIWLEQADCALFRHGNMIFGFCRRDEVDSGGIITFFYETREKVDEKYRRFKDIAVSEPSYNEKYRIYQFFARDPEGRILEFQHFDHPVNSHLMADELLLTRRSIRKFKQTEISRETLDRLFDLCRYAPTSMNTQSYYFKVITDRDLLDKLASVREKSSSPIGNASMAVAICSDPGLSRRHIQDGCIAAYHFLLAARAYGLGTCWIAAMDREDVKKWLEIPQNHYIATVTPLGYPVRPDKPAPERKDLSWYVKKQS